MFLWLESGGFINLKNIIIVLFVVVWRNFYIVLDIFNGGYVYMDNNLII